MPADRPTPFSRACSRLGCTAAVDQGGPVVSLSPLVTARKESTLPPQE